MKNITVTMDDTVAEWVRVEAAKRGSSVSRLLGEWLAEKFGYTTQKTDSKRSSIRDLPPSWRWTMLEKACPGGLYAVLCGT